MLIWQECNLAVFNDNLEEIKTQFKNVPFGESVFQINKFNRGQETPERLYRNCLLQLDKKIRALYECKFRRRRIEVDIAELKSKLHKANSFDKQRHEIDIEEKEYQLDNEIKLIEDAFIEVETYKQILKTLPVFTREEFEKGEGEYWKRRLLGDMKNEVFSIGHVNQDTIKSLGQIGIVVGRNEKGQIAYSEKPLLPKEYEELAEGNIINFNQ